MVPADVRPGQLRRWKSRYFQQTPPTEGWEYFLVMFKCGDDKWTVRFAAEKDQEMSEESIMELTDVIG